MGATAGLPSSAQTRMDKLADANRGPSRIAVCTIEPKKRNRAPSFGSSAPDSHGWMYWDLATDWSRSSD